MTTIQYRKGYKYQLADTYFHQLPADLFEGIVVSHPLFTIRNSLLTIRMWYAWDGPSGPAFDTPSFMRPSLVHDVFYQMLRLKLLPASLFQPGIGVFDTREWADNEMYRLCREDGMWPPRAWWCQRAVRKFAAGAATTPRPIITAP